VQQFERLSVAGPDDSEVTPVQGGDSDRAMPFGQGDHGGVGAAQRHTRADRDQLADSIPVGAAEGGDIQVTVDDGGI
jgi:hypothetical protein